MTSIFTLLIPKPSISATSRMLYQRLAGGTSDRGSCSFGCGLGMTAMTAPLAIWSSSVAASTLDSPSVGMVDTYVSRGGGALDAANPASLPGECGGGVGEHGVAAVVPAGADVVEVGVEDGGLLVVVLGLVDVFGAPPDDAVVAQDPKGDGVAAGLGQEVAAEAEHVGPS